MVTSYERNNTIRLTCIFKSGSVATYPVSANISIKNPNGTYILTDASGHRTGTTGEYYYYISTNSTSDLGLYVTEWHGDIQYSVWGRLPFMDRDSFLLTTIA